MNNTLINTLIIYLFILYIIFLNKIKVTNEIYIILPIIIYYFFNNLN
jgi:hypothetical protein